MAANVLYPRSVVPRGLGAAVRAERQRRCWSQERLARRVGACRRTIARLEAGTHLPSPGLVHAIEDALVLGRLVRGWQPKLEADAPAYGPRARRARLAAGLTLNEVARAAGVSPATLSRFERELGDSPRLVGGFDDGPTGIRSDGLALALGFQDARDMNAYCMAKRPLPQRGIVGPVRLFGRRARLQRPESP